MSDLIKFKRIRVQCIRLSDIKHKNYILSVENNLRRNMHAFWSYVNTLNRNEGYQSSMALGDEFSSSDLGSANIFASFFGSVYSGQSTCHNGLDRYVRQLCPNFRITRIVARMMFPHIS